MPSSPINLDRCPTTNGAPATNVQATSQGAPPSWPKYPKVAGGDCNKKAQSYTQDETSLYSDLKQWTVDILSCCLACIALTAIIITLATHNNRTIPRWRFGISVNALVSVFATIWKAAMLAPVANALSQLKWSWFRKPRPLIELLTFDEASRGTIGSIWLIGKLRTMNLASFGACISILAIASDPFIQQVLKYNNCQRSMENQIATLERTNAYYDNSLHVDNTIVTLSYGLQAALFEGAYNSFKQDRPGCVTGNCTFPDYRTLAFCAACEDISSTLTEECHHNKEAPLPRCRWALPSGLNFSFPSGTAEVLVMAPPANNFPDFTNGVASNIEIISLTTVLDYRTNSSYPWQGLLARGPQSVMGLQCTLRPCVRTYSTEVVQNNPIERLVAVHNTTYNTTDPFGAFVATPMPCLINGTYYPAEAFAQRNATNVNEVYGLLPKNASAWLPNECIFAYTDPLGLFDNLPAFFTGHASATSAYGNYANPGWLGQLFKNDTATLATVNETWTNIADSMTAFMRRNGRSGYNSPVVGEVWQTETCITVQWPWLVYPVALLCMTIILLVCTIVESVSHHSGRIWKSSPIALLFHGLPASVTDTTRDILRTEEMDKTAARVMASLVDDANGTGLAGYIGGKFR